MGIVDWGFGMEIMIAVVDQTWGLVSEDQDWDLVWVLGYDIGMGIVEQEFWIGDWDCDLVFLNWDFDKDNFEL